MQYDKNYKHYSKDQELLIQCLNYLETNYKIVDGKINFDFGIYHDIVIEVLAKNPLLSEFTDKTKKDIIYSSIKRWLQYKRTDNQNHNIVKFFQALNVEIARIEKNKSKYKILMFLNIDQGLLDSLIPIKVIDRELQFLSWEDAKIFNIDNLIDIVYSQDRLNPIVLKHPKENFRIPNVHEFTPVVCELETYSIEAAVGLASDGLDLLRSVLNISSVLGQYIIFRSEPKALSKFLPSPVYAIYNDLGNLVNIYFNSERYEYRKPNRNVVKIESAALLLSKVSTTPSSTNTWAYLIEIFRLYQKALDTTVTEEAFLSMWIVLENLARIGNDQITNKEITKRLVSLLESDLIIRNMIEILIMQRNDFVHSGKFRENPDKVFFILKNITDYSLRRVISLADEYTRISELRAYMQYLSVNDHDLDLNKTVIEKIISSRNKKRYNTGK